MEDTTISRVADALLDAYGYEDELELQGRAQHRVNIVPMEVGKEMDPALQAALSEALALLPDDALWAISQPEPGVYVLAGSTLYLVSIEPNHKAVAVKNRDIMARRIVVEAEPPRELDPGEVLIRHTWSFGYGKVGTLKGVDDEEPEMMRRIEGIVFQSSQTDDKWLDRAEQIARTIADHSGVSAPLTLPTTGVEQELSHAGRDYLRLEPPDGGEFRPLVKDAITRHDLTAERISVLTGVPVDEITGLNAPDPA